MTADDKPVLLYPTVPSLEDGERLGGLLVERRLAACVNLIPGMVAIYVWEGKRHRDGEVVMIAKTRASLADEAVAALRAAHPYDNPALDVIGIDGGSPDFLRWIGEQTGPGAGPGIGPDETEPDR